MTRRRAQPDPFDDDSTSAGLLGSLGALIANHPSLAGGAAAFAVIFGFVSANAVWYQPGAHPAPILKTRDAADLRPAETSSNNPAAATQVATDPDSDAIRAVISGVPARRVTTYRIERGDDTSTASIPVPGATVEADGRAPTRPSADPLVAQIQAALVDRGLYSGTVDGLMGPRSAAAILAFEKQAGLPQTGLPSTALANVLTQGGTAAPKAVPREAPRAAPVDSAAVATPTPRPSGGVVQPVLAADARPSGPVTEPALANPASDLVRQIQTGLSNIAYADIDVDGVIGTQTRSAIRAFERHYRLPETGAPNRAVLDKLREIGAL